MISTSEWKIQEVNYKDTLSVSHNAKMTDSSLFINYMNKT